MKNLEIKKGGIYLMESGGVYNFIKGNIYKSPVDGYLVGENLNLVKVDVTYFTDKIAVHVPTQEDCDFVIGKVRDEYYGCWSSYSVNTSISLKDGCFADKEFYGTNNYHIITIEKFRALFPGDVAEKVFIIGNATRGADVISKLESLGGSNGFYNLRGDCEGYFYFIKEDGMIFHSFKKPKGYTEIFLDDSQQSSETIPNKEQFSLNSEDSLPRLMLVRSSKSDNWHKRVVVGFKNGYYLAWKNASTMEQAEKSLYITPWKEAKGLTEEDSVLEVTMAEVAAALGKELGTFKIV